MFLVKEPKISYDKSKTTGFVGKMSVGDVIIDDYNKMMGEGIIKKLYIGDYILYNVMQTSRKGTFVTCSIDSFEIR